jgi:hypothetical protein
VALRAEVDFGPKGHDNTAQAKGLGSLPPVIVYGGRSRGR